MAPILQHQTDKESAMFAILGKISVETKGSPLGDYFENSVEDCVEVSGRKTEGIPEELC